MSIQTKTNEAKHILQPLLLSPKPGDLFTLVYAVNYTCNSKCVMCNIWKRYREDPARAKGELTVDEIRNVFRKSHYLQQVRSIIVGGGEPVLKKDFVDVILLLYSLNPSLNMVIATNGRNPVLLERKLRRIRIGLHERGLGGKILNVGVALDGMEATHDAARGIKGTYRRAMETVGRVRNLEGTRVGFSFTVTPRNYREFEDVYNLTKQMGVIFGYQFAHTSSHYYGNTEMKFEWTMESLNEMKDILKRTGLIRNPSGQSLKYRVLNIEQYFSATLFKYLEEPKRYFDCHSGTHSCFMDPYGNVFPCIMLDRKLGNILDQGFDRLWTSPEAEKVRKHISQWKCHCFSFCDVPHSLKRNLRVNLWNLKKMFSGHLGI